MSTDAGRPHQQDDGDRYRPDVQPDPVRDDTRAPTDGPSGDPAPIGRPPSHPERVGNPEQAGPPGTTASWPGEPAAGQPGAGPYADPVGSQPSQPGWAGAPAEPIGHISPVAPQVGPGGGPPEYPPYGPPQLVAGGRPAGRWGRRLAAAGVLVAVALGSGAAGAALVDRSATTTTTTAASAVSVSGSAPTEQLAKVAAAVQPSVVSITVTTGSGGDEGSGVLIRSDGTILTNNHVVSAAADGGSISVKFSSGRTATASIVGRDPATDLAVIKAAGVSGLTPATLGAVSSLHVGDTVLAIGSPLGLDGSVSSGIVSALHRSVDLSSSERQSGSVTTTVVSDAIQTDAAVNPGNSGGALVDAQGRVVGINTAIASLGGGGTSTQSGSIGVGFAIPIDEATSVAGQLLKGQTPTHAVLGVSVNDTAQGALVQSVSNGSAAAAGGIAAGDVITSVGRRTVDGGTTLAAAVRAHKPGERVEVVYTRGGSRRTSTVTLGSASN